MARQFVMIAAILGFLGVAIGAFGAHGLEATLEANGRVDTFETASQYHLIHAVAMLGLAWASMQYTSPLVMWSGYLLTVGTVIFSGSLYILAIADLGWMGAIAPIGGTMLLVGWGCLGYAAWAHRQAES